MPEIETARLRLRPLTLDDLDEYYAVLRSDPDVMRYLPGGQPQPRERAEQAIRFHSDYWRDHNHGGFAVIHKADGRLIGDCGLQIIPAHTDIELFYAFARPYWGQGYASEAGHACLRFGFETAGLDRIYAMFMPDNTASELVMIKLGMTSIGLYAAYNTQLPCYVISRDDFVPGDAPYRLT